MENSLPQIPAKRYFTIGEVGELCGVKPHVLRYWEQEFTQLRPMKRRGNRRYYQHHEVLMIRRIRELLYDQGFTISGARNKMHELMQSERDKRQLPENMPESVGVMNVPDTQPAVFLGHSALLPAGLSDDPWHHVRHELHEIRALLSPAL
jgi:DNA-binding transcriptional MerR regulator